MRDSEPSPQLCWWASRGGTRGPNKKGLAEANPFLFYLVGLP
ncbi:MAG: hypothetical protein JWR22_897 [Herminiimonas sp.]|nr:hypothetical protein [Herminiimonas sp.]